MLINEIARWSRTLEFDGNTSSFDLNWLKKPYNVFKELESRYGEIQLERIGQRHINLELYEQNFFGSTSNFVREIYLKHYDEHLTYGRVIFSTEAYNKLKEQIEELGDKPIGTSLFYKNNYLRSSFEYMKLDNTHPLFINASRNLPKKPNIAYARRSIFTPPGDEASIISLQEVFFPWIKSYG